MIDESAIVRPDSKKTSDSLYASHEGPNQNTLKESVTVNGVGLHTGKHVKLTMRPATPGYGIRFQRTDLPDAPIVKADVDYVTDTSRGTTIEHNGARISTIEHMLAAMVGLGVDNVLVELDGPEVPILDGSSRQFIDAIESAGIQEQEAKRIVYSIDTNIHYYDPVKNVDMLAIPSTAYQITALIDFNSPVLGTQHATMKHLGEFRDEIGPCRTFCFLHELEYLLDNNLIKGGDLNNAIVVVDKIVSQDELNRLAQVFNKPSIQVKQEGILNNIQMHFTNEPARHKLLDVVGDLALVGSSFNAHIIASRPGHATNVEFAKKLKQYIKKNKHLSDIPQYDPSQQAVFDINHITKKLPHKFPFLYVDKVIELSDKHVVGIKNVTFNEHFFQGHFPGNPVMPGVIQIEALAQTGGILALNNYQDPENYDTYFLKIDKVKFKHKVVPGDTLILKMELLSPIRRGICEMRGTVYVGNKLMTEAELVAQIIRKDKKMIHPLTYVHPDSKIAPNVKIDPFTTIHKNVEIGEGTWIGSNVTIMEGARIGKNVRIFPSSVISAIPQDLKFKGEDTITIIGDNTTIRECVTINRGTSDRNATKIGNNCLIMAYSHIAHDCEVGNYCIFSNNTTLAGHIIVGDHVVLAGLTAVQQFVRIGSHAFVTGGSLVRKDIPPFVKAAREPLSYVGVNSVGLKRRGYSIEKINHILDIYRILFVRGFNVSKALSIIETEIPVSDERDEIISFVRDTGRGIMKGYTRRPTGEDIS